MPWRRHGITVGICILGIGVCGFLWNGYFGVMLTLVAESAPYLLIGFALAGVLKAIVPEDKGYKHLGDNRFKSVALASLFEHDEVPILAALVLGATGGDIAAAQRGEQGGDDVLPDLHARNGAGFHRHYLRAA